MVWCRQSTSESWAQFNHDNVTRAEHERMASIQMRTLSDNILHDTARDIREQADAVDNAFERRIREMEDCKAKLMENLRKVSTCFTLYVSLYLFSVSSLFRQPSATMRLPRDYAFERRIREMARWLSGRASDLRSKSRGFEPRPRRCCATTL